MSRKIAFTEVYGTIDNPSYQTVGIRNGVKTLFVNMWGCNLTCDGFSQIDPTNHETYDLSYQKIKSVDVTEPITFNTGCNRSYSWGHKFKNLSKRMDIVEFVDHLEEHIPGGTWVSKYTSQRIDLCFTGGEPMMQQRQIADVLDEIYRRSTIDVPGCIQIETNGTLPLEKELKATLSLMDSVCFNVSPKLFNVSGERNAVNPENIIKLVANSHPKSNHSINFTMNKTKDSWDELLDTVHKINHVKEFNSNVGLLNYYVSSVGHVVDTEILNKSLVYGFNISHKEYV